MATVALTANFQMTNNGSLDVSEPTTISNRSASGFTISDSKGLSATLAGSNFGYNASGEWISGTATAAAWKQNGQTTMSIDGASVSGGLNVYDAGYGGEAPGMQAEMAYWLRSNDVIIGSTGSEIIKGYGGNDSLTGGAGNDTIDGGSGTDTATYASASSNFTITKTGASYTVKDNTGTLGTDTLSNVERLQFTDKTVALDLSGNAGQSYRVYQAAFNRTPDNAGLKYWINAMDSGASLQQIAAGFLTSAEFKSLYGSNPTAADFVNKLYQNVLHRAGEQGGVNYWNNELNSGHQSMAQVLAGFSESAENQAAVIGVIQSGINLT